MNRTVTIVLPSGYKDGGEFAKDCGFELTASQERVAAIAQALRNYHQEHPMWARPPEAWDFYQLASFIDAALNGNRPLCPKCNKESAFVHGEWVCSECSIYGVDELQDPSDPVRSAVLARHDRDLLDERK